MGDAFASPFSSLSHSAKNADFAIRIFYALNFYFCGIFIESKLGVLDTMVALNPVWPIFWLKSLGATALWGRLFLWFNFLSSFLAMALPRWRAFRVMSFLGIFFFTALLHSDAAGWQRMSGDMQYPLIAFLFIFLPRGEERTRRQKWTKVSLVLLAQITIMAAYGNSAIWRLREAALEYLSDGFSILNSQGMVTKLVAWERLTGRVSPVDSLFMNHPTLTGPSMLIGTILELSVLWALFRPRLYRTWGVLLATFHIGIALLFLLTFKEQFILMLALLVCVPPLGERRSNH